jgi:hypothetical protein
MPVVVSILQSLRSPVRSRAAMSPVLSLAVVSSLPLVKKNVLGVDARPGLEAQVRESLLKEVRELGCR